MSHSTQVVALRFWNLPLEVTLAIREAEPATQSHPGAGREVAITEVRLMAVAEGLGLLQPLNLTELVNDLQPSCLVALEIACLERMSQA